MRKVFAILAVVLVAAVAVPEVAMAAAKPTAGELLLLKKKKAEGLRKAITEIRQLRLVIEQVHLRRSARLKQVDHALGPRREVRDCGVLRGRGSSGG